MSEPEPSGPRPGDPFPASELVEVPLLRIPVPVWAQSQEHIDELLREFTLIAAHQREQGVPHDVPRRLIHLIDDLTVHYGGFNTDQENRLAEASRTGLPEIDLIYRIPPKAAQACSDLQRLLDQADEYCRAGEHLLTLATPAELVRFRNWFLEEFIRQLAGERPRAWPDYPE